MEPQHSVSKVQPLDSISHSPFKLPTPSLSPLPPPSVPPPLQDWGEATDVSIFYGRAEELATLERWVIHDRCRLVGLFGMGGIGKTALSVKLAKQLVGRRAEEAVAAPGEVGESLALPGPQPNPFTHVIWRSLRNAPPIHDLLADLILALSNQRETVLPDGLDRRMLRLLEYLRNCRCLLILDNGETVMQAGDRNGSYQPGYEGYGQLLRCVGETDHQSCLLLTSREKPKGFAPREGESLPVRSLQVTGLNPTIGRELFNLKGTFTGSPENWQALINHYSGNPLALKIVATAIADFFDGSIAQFLEFTQPGNSVFGDIRDLLARQIGRLSTLEQKIMVWLAINRESISFTELQTDCIPSVSPSDLLDTLTALERRSLIEKRGSCFTLQPAVMEYMTERLINQVCEEIGNGQVNRQVNGQINGQVNGQVEVREQRVEKQGVATRGPGEGKEAKNSSTQPSTLNPLCQPLSLLRSHALIKAQTKDFIRDAQIRLILKPIAERLLLSHSQAELDSQLMQILAVFRGKVAQEVGYLGGNIINLLCQLQVDLSQRDFSHLIIWQAYLRQVTLHHTNLSYSDLSKSVFTETFSQILAVAFSPDGNFLAASDISYEVHVWRVTDGKKFLTCKASDGWMWSVAFSPDSRLLASSANGTIHLWDLLTGVSVQTIRSYTSRIFSLAFSPDGCFLASGNEDHEIRIWSVATGELIAVLSGHTDEVRSVAFSPDGCLLASGSYDRTIKLWDMAGVGKQRVAGSEPQVEPETGRRRYRDRKNFEIQNSNCTLHPPSLSLPPPTPGLTLTGHTHWVWSVAFSPDGKTLASSSSDCTIKLWDPQTGHCIKTLVGHTQPIRSLVFIDPLQPVQAVGDEGQPQASHPPSPIPLSPVPTRLADAHASPSPIPQLVSGSDDLTVRLWNSEGDCLRVLQGHTSWISAVAVSPDGCLLASGSEDQSVRLWDSRTNHCLRVLQGYNSGVWAVAFSPDGHTLVSGGQDRMVRIWTLADSSQQAAVKADGEHRLPPSFLPLSGHASWIWSVAVSPDGQAIASGSEDGTINLWKVAEIGRQQVEEDTERGRYGTAKKPYTQYSAAMQNTSDAMHPTRAADAPSSPKPTRLGGHTHAVWSVAFSPDSRIIASGSLDGTVRLWCRLTGQCHHVLRQHQSGVWSVAFSPMVDAGKGDRQLLASGSQDQTIRLWEIVPHRSSNRSNEHQPELVVRLLKTLEGHVSWIRCIAFSPNGQFLASGSSDGSVKLWLVNTGECLQTFEAHSSLVLAITFSPDGRTLTTGGGDGTIKLWNISEGRRQEVEGRRQKLENQDSPQHLALSAQPATSIQTSNLKPSLPRPTPHSPSPTLLITLKGHHKWVRFLAYSPSGKMLASCSQDGSVKLWDARRLTLFNGEPDACLETLRVPRPYEGADITGLKGLSEAQKETLKILGAVD
ncbi:MAG: hypothetical protein WCA35_28185 [Kovacikia sp.]